MADRRDSRLELICRRQLRFARVRRGDHLVSAVSGGADSLALLLILADLQMNIGFTLSVAHLNHGLRGDDSDADEAFVRDWANRLDLPFDGCRVDVRAAASARRVSCELAGREIRRDFLIKTADRRRPDHGQSLVVLAHHQDDQAESILLHIGRGSGLDGLAAMRLREGPLIRPLLDIRRSELEQYLQRRGLTWRHDASNDSDETIRNRLRHEVLPVWQQALGYSPVPVLARLADNVRIDRAYLRDQAERAWQSLADADGTLSAAKLLALPQAMRRRVWRRFIASGTSAVHLRALDDWLMRGGGEAPNLPGGRTVRIQSGRLILQANRDPDSDDGGDAWDGEVAVVVPGRTEVPGSALAAALGAAPGAAPGIAAVLATRVENPFSIDYNDRMECVRPQLLARAVLRRRRAGDRIRPARGGGSKSLRKFLIERQVERALRDRLIVLADGAEILWIPGLPDGRTTASMLSRDARENGAAGVLLRWLELPEHAGDEPQA